jgi:hypothetical protein
VYCFLLLAEEPRFFASLSRLLTYRGFTIIVHQTNMIDNSNLLGNNTKHCSICMFCIKPNWNEHNLLSLTFVLKVISLPIYSSTHTKLMFFLNLSFVDTTAHFLFSLVK